jgi:Flp pilus assembly protein TadG
MERRHELIKRIRQLLRREDGGALAELAILIPFLAVMLAGVCEFGRYFQHYNTLAKATRSASRYLSNHKLTAAEIDRAQSLVVCGKLACADSDRKLLPNIAKANVCVESTGSPKVTSVTVRIPRPDLACNPTTNAPAASPYTYQPIFNIGALLGTNLSMALPIAPSVTMYYMIN